MDNFKSIYDISDEEELEQRIKNKTTNINELTKQGYNALTSEDYIKNRTNKFIEILIREGLDVDIIYNRISCFTYIYDEHLCELIIEHSKNKSNSLYYALRDLNKKTLTKQQLQSRINLMVNNEINLLTYTHLFVNGSNNMIEILLNKIEQIYSRQELIKFIMSTNMWESNVFQCNLEDKNLSIYNFVMNKLPVDKQIELLSNKDSSGDNVLISLIAEFTYNRHYHLIYIIHEVLKIFKDINETNMSGENAISLLIVEHKKDYNYNAIYELIIKLIDMGANTNIIYEIEGSPSENYKHHSIDLVGLIELRNPPFANDLISYIKFGNLSISSKSANKRTINNN